MVTVVLKYCCGVMVGLVMGHQVLISKNKWHYNKMGRKGPESREVNQGSGR